MDIFDALDHHAVMRPFDLAVVHPRGSLNFLQLRTVIAATAMRLRNLGVEPGRVAAVYINDPFLHLAVTLGLMLNGTPSVSAHPNHDPMPPQLDVAFYLSDRDMQIPASARLARVTEDWVRTQEAGRFPRPRGFADPDAVCRIITSSGTTGAPKAVAHSSRSLAAMTMRQLSLDSIYAAGPNINMIAFGSFSGFNTAHVTLWAGSLLVLAVGPVSTLRAISLYSVRTLAASPAQLQGLINVLKSGTARFPSLQQIRIGGSALPSTLAQRARTLLCSNIICRYSSTEVGFVAAAPGSLVEAQPGLAGHPLPDTVVRIVDENGNAVAAGQEGIVQIRTPHMALGYYGDPVATREAFRDGWFIPGDIGSLSEAGMLTILGRQKELINAGGVKVSPQLIDEVLLSLPGVREAAAFPASGISGGDAIWAAVVVDGPFDEAALRAACVGRLNSRAPVRFVQMTELPRNAMGKVLRDKLRQAVAAAPRLIIE